MRVVHVLSLLVLAGTIGSPQTGGHHDRVETAAAARITPQLVERDTRELGSPRYEGRAPGTHGETLTVRYIEREFRRAGLAPGNPDGSYRQRFDLYNQRTTRASGRMSIGATVLSVSAPADFAVQTLPMVSHTTIDSAALVFAGHCVVAPELEWNDYKDVDVRGKVVMCLPGVPSELGGFSPSYHQVAMDKRRSAAEHGAAALVMLDPAPAALVRAERAGTFEIADTSTPPLFISLGRPRSTELFAAAGLDAAALARGAGQRGFRPVTIGTMSFEMDAEWQRIATQNVIARLEGSDPARRDEYVVFTAHWDAWGIIDGAINHGTADNAAGTAGLLAIGRALAAMRPRPSRTFLFIATSSEERGLYGARYYARHPLYSLARTVANVNIDLYGAPIGRARDVVIFGEGRSTLDDVVHDVARSQGRRVSPDPVPSEGVYLRMDHMAFAEVGVTAVSLAPGFDLIDKPAGFAKHALDDWVANRYHRPGDVIYPAWDWDGLALDVRTSMLVGLRLARDGMWPEWKPTAEFFLRRQQMRKD